MQFIENGPDIPEALLQAQEEGRVVFFCGAGISYPAGLPGLNRPVNRPGFPRRLGASGSDAAQTLQAAGRQHLNDDVWGYRTFRCS